MYDPRTPLEVIEDFQSEGIEIVPAVHPDQLMLSSLVNVNENGLPLAGISNRTSIFCNEGGEYLIYESDEHGFHNPKGLYDAGETDIIALGDSFTQGACVGSNKNSIAIIRNKYKNTLNLGEGGNGPLLELATLKEFAQPLKPKIVLWLYYESNDLRDMIREARVDLLRKYLEEEDFNQDLITKQPEIDRMLYEFVEERKQQVLEEQLEDEAERSLEERIRENAWVKFIVLDYLANNLGLTEEIKEKDTPIDAEMFRKILMIAKDTTESWGGKLYFVYLPEWQRYNKPELADPHRDEVLVLVNDLGIPIMDIHKSFVEASDNPLIFFPYKMFGHYNEAGYKLVAETIIDSIE
jgi:hypothetical protein